MVKATLEFSEGRWPVFVTITSDTEEKTVALLEQMKLSVERADYSDQLVWIDYPIYYHSNRGLPQFYEILSRDTAAPFALANDRKLVEGRKSNIKHKNIRTSVLKKLAGMDCVQGLVFTGSLKRAMNYQKAVRHSSDFKFYDGNEAAFMRQPSSDGVSAAGANLLPQAWRDITWSCLNQYDVERQYADHVSQMWEQGVMVQAFYDLYRSQPAAALKRMLHVAGILPNAHTASRTPSTDGMQNKAIEAICRKYDLI
jgi:dihydrodipicolinate synthase/N-acetylneuraminate lyase